MTPINLFLSKEEKENLVMEASIVGKITRSKISLSQLIRLKLFQTDQLVQILQQHLEGNKNDKRR
jgi:hypothetical protein